MTPIPMAVAKNNQIKLLLFQILGTIYLPFSFRIKIFNIVIEYCWCVLHLTQNLLLFVWFYIYYNKAPEWDDYGKQSFKVQDLIVMVTHLIHQTFKNVLYFYHRHSTKIVIESIEELTSSLNKGFQDSHGFLYGMIGCCIIIASCDLYLIYLNFGSTAFVYLIPYELYFISWLLEVNLIYIILGRIKQNFCGINRRLVILLENRRRKLVPVGRILNTIKFYDKVNQTAKLANAIFGFSIVTSVNISISLIGTVTYMQIFTFVDASSFADRYMLPTMGWLIYLFATVLIITFPWISTSIEANKTATHIHDIWNKHAREGFIDSNLNHLPLISLALLNTKLNFTAYGFFPLDWTLLQVILGAVTSYVVILVQLEGAIYKM